MDVFCGSQFWDWNTTWFTDDPDLTPCFENTILIWIPCTFLWLCSFLDIYFFSTSDFPPIPLTKLHFSKCFSNVAVLLLTIFHIFLTVSEEASDVAPVVIYSNIIKTSTFVLALILVTCDRIKGFRSSGVQFLFWLLFSISESVILRTNIINRSESQLFFVTRTVYCAFVYLSFLLNCFADTGVSIFQQDHILLEETDSENYPELKASFLSRLTFYWVGNILQLGYKRPLEFTDLWNLRLEDKTRHACSLFLKHYKKLSLQNDSKEKNDENKEGNSDGWFSALVLPLIKSFRLQYLVLMSIGILGNFIGVITPMVLSYLIDFITNGPEENMWKGYFFAVVMYLLSLLNAMIMHQYLYLLWVVAYRLRAALNSAIYRKALLISTCARKGTSVGEIVNLMSVDVDKVMIYSVWMFEFLTSLVQLVGATYLLQQQLGVAAYSGFLVMLFLIPTNIFVMRKVQILQQSQMIQKDERVKIMNEILSGVKIIKLYAWELSFMDLVRKIRSAEIKLLTKKAILLAVNSFVWRMIPFYLSLTCFTAYILIDRKNTLDAKKAFVSLAMFNIMRKPMNCLFQAIILGVDCLVSLKRINKFMNYAEKDPSAVNHILNTNSEDDKEDSAVKIENGDFAWDDERIILKNINVRIKKGSLVAIVGAVGCGKSSILEALLGEMKKMRGKVSVAGTVAYVSQLPYIQNATVEKNITFGAPFVFQKYENIIDCCALRPDLDILPGKDQTEIGEKGINLSGGQKQRVALARAAYYYADVFLLDDPLSSVDSNVGKHIFENLIGPEGLLKDKTRIWVTNGVSFLPHVDQIIVLNEGEISECGTYTELLEQRGLFSDFLLQYGTKTESEDLDDKNSKKSVGGKLHLDTGPKIEMDKLIEDETMETGNIKAGVIGNYVKRVGWLASVGVILSFTLAQIFSIGGNLWLSYWSKPSKANFTATADFQKNQDIFLGVYGALGLGQGLFLFSASCCIYFGALGAAKKLHNNMLLRILRAPMWFFDTTPLGRIVNRFGSDVQTLDQDVPGTMYDTLTFLFQILAILIVVCFSTPIFLIVVAIIIPVFIAIQRYFTAASRQMFRLNSVARSPIYSHFSETLNGVTTIRAYGAQERFIDECETRIDNMQKTLIPLTTSRRWLSVRLQILGSLFLLFTAIFAVTARNSLSPSIVGLSITYALQISTNLLYMTIFITFLETQIVSAERIMEYTKVDQEDEWEKPGKSPETDWPQKGAISFRNYQTRYREGTNLVLNGISCNIEPGEKIGIAGRTGAGKSSITLGLFRILEAAGGSIIIDGEDISTLGMHDIRGRLTIIPQDPVLFSGTLRFNLDPFYSVNHSCDTELWTALEHSHLKTFVQELPAGLDHEILEGGGNLSTGQRQLVCLARAILRKCKILILDEATAAVDLETDCLIQNTIRKQFKDCTVITIAHRLNTIMDSDRIMVLAQGEIQEFDSPANLLSNSNSLFYDMASSAGLI